MGNTCRSMVCDHEASDPPKFEEHLPENIVGMLGEAAAEYDRVVCRCLWGQQEKRFQMNSNLNIS